jgi:predicted 3-demethylubiquinone-9 3-methyltransferase (glyoxalase superfamily)
MSSISPFLWFDTQAEEAAELYVSLFPNSSISNVARTPEGTVFTVTFVLDGVEFQALNAGPHHMFNEAVSFFIRAETQERIDELWSKLTADGGEPGQCGWLKDRFGLSWQVVPPRLGELLSDPAVSQPVMQAMFGMQKLVIADLEAAAVS